MPVKKPRRVAESTEPLCVTPQDLYSLHARDRIGRLLEDWLARQRVTPFELLHRTDLVEKLEAGGSDLTHAIQKIAIPEAQARGKGTHEMMRTFQGLVERAMQRLALEEPIDRKRRDAEHRDRAEHYDDREPEITPEPVDQHRTTAARAAKNGVCARTCSIRAIQVRRPAGPRNAK